ncbi:hypothetical protein [Actinoalloteichus hymeniacidonis]|uniref:PE domain-containing protein n=1 Tax=Actinoalloteichus hymeniacidonis TaxID=340345 RepID=A0AAC9HND2_9PSEU|nr:hypothetical protein [Actinoalloteichus hymeniacidonis]AOS62394.1 hypothetical protein TL08_07885 [Actinoalloteichus hymeniacidonis]MBB5909576.1 hypothetical protein [Actinoalloteichus hymeniacidonis]
MEDRGYPTDPGPGPAVSGGSFEVDPENIQKLIDGLNEAIDELNDISRDATSRLGQLQPPGADDYSTGAVRLITDRVLEDDGAHGAANKAFREALEATVDNLTTTLNEYRRIEEENSQIGNIDV